MLFYFLMLIREISFKLDIIIMKGCGCMWMCVCVCVCIRMLAISQSIMFLMLV